MDVTTHHAEKPIFVMVEGNKSFGLKSQDQPPQFIGRPPEMARNNQFFRRDEQSRASSSVEEDMSPG